MMVQVRFMLIRVCRTVHGDQWRKMAFATPTNATAAARRANPAASGCAVQLEEAKARAAIPAVKAPRTAPPPTVVALDTLSVKLMVAPTREHPTPVEPA